MNYPTFSELPSQTQLALAGISAAIEGVLPVEVRSWLINVSALPSEPDRAIVIREVSAWAAKSKACLYYFECRAPEIDLTNVELTFADAKAHEAKDRAYPRRNAQVKCFYVGSSQSVAKRLKEHLGYGASKTYALQMIHWARTLSLELEFVCAKYAESTTPEIIQALEDTLWKTRAPVFSRQGRK